MPDTEAAPGVPKRAWGEPLKRLDRAWTALESRLCAAVLLAEIAALCLWISLKGLSAEYTPGSGDKSGLVYRALLGAAVLGVAANRAFRGRARHDVAVTAAVVLGALGARAWANVGSEYFANLLNWMQSASFLTLIGGVSGIAKRLTLWLALLGASLATGQGKHINVDVVMRFLTPKLRVPVAVVGWLTAAVVCAAGVWGFFDHIAIESFRAPATAPCPEDPNKTCDVPPGAKIATVQGEMGKDLFLAGRQLSLDVRSFPRVIAGTKYDTYLHAAEWNAWMAGGGWEAHYDRDAVASLKMSEDAPEQTHLPIISIPGSAENVPGLLVKDLNFIFPFGLFIIALRFVLRALLAISGQVRVDPDAAHGDDDVAHAHEGGGLQGTGGAAGADKGAVPG